jgi:hypothetical protein
MFDDKPMKCPNCDDEMERGFSIRNSPLSFVTPEKLQKTVHRDEDLNRAGVKVLVPSKATYNAAWHCRDCRILIVDYSRAIPSREAKAQALAQMAGSR